MEDLNNRQMVLLTMFSSFIISIATGIITVAMLQVAPETVTNTVNKVVEHTIERIVTGTTTTVSSGPTVTNITKEVTVYAKEDDLVVSAVEKNQPRIALIYAMGAASSSDPQALGFVVSRDGLIATEPKGLSSGGAVAESYTVRLGEQSYTATPLPNQDMKQQVYFLKLNDLTASSTIDAVTYGRSDNTKVAQTLVVLGGNDGTGVFKATVSKLRYTKTDATSSPEQLLTGMTTNPKIPEQNIGALVVNLDGQVVGMVVIDQSDDTKSVVYPISRILDLVVALPSKTSELTAPHETLGG